MQPDRRYIAVLVRGGVGDSAWCVEGHVVDVAPYSFQLAYQPPGEDTKVGWFKFSGQRLGDNTEGYHRFEAKPVD